MKKIKVENEKALVKDTSTGAVLNIDTEALKQHRRSRNAAKNQSAKLNELEEKIKQLEILINQITKVV